MGDDGMYGSRAELYDPIYHWKDYPAEAEALHALLAAEGVADGADVVEAACGTGSALVQLARWYRVSGFDLSPDMLAIARRKLPDTDLRVADMRTWAPDAPVDAVLCLFSSIGYLLTLDDLRAAAIAFHGALRPGGVCVVEPWLTPDRVDARHTSLQTYSSPELKLARASGHVQAGPVSELTFHWLVARPGTAEHFSEVHRLRVSTREELLDAFTSAGFTARFDDEAGRSRGAVIARRA